MKLRRTLIIAFAVLSALAVWDMVASGPDRFENRMFVYVEFSDGIGRVPRAAGFAGDPVAGARGAGGKRRRGGGTYGHARPYDGLAPGGAVGRRRGDRLSTPCACGRTGPGAQRSGPPTWPGP